MTTPLTPLSREQVEGLLRFQADTGMVGQLLAHDAALREDRDEWQALARKNLLLFVEQRDQLAALTKGRDFWSEQNGSAMETVGKLSDEIEAMEARIAEAIAKELDEVCLHIMGSRLNDPKNLTQQAFNDACLDLVDWARGRAAAIRQAALTGGGGT